MANHASTYSSTSENGRSITTQEAQYEIFKQIDQFCSGIFNEFKAIDDAFGNIADFFFNMAEEYDSRATHSKKNDDELTDDEIVELALVTVGFATRGVGNLINAVKAKLTLQTILNNLRKEAGRKMKFIDKFVEQTSKICDLNWQNLQNQVEAIDLSPNAPNMTNFESFANNIQQPIVTSVNMLRTSLYHHRMMQYLQEEYKYWVHGEIGKGVMPDYGDINREIVFSCLFNSTPATTVDKMEPIIKAIYDNSPFILGSFDLKRSVPLILDKQLMATYLAVRPHESGELPGLDDDDNNPSCLKRALMNNPAYNQYITLNGEFMSLNGKRKLRFIAIVLNVILFTYLCYKFASAEIDTAWLTWTTVGIGALVAAWRAKSVIQDFWVKYEYKMQELQLHTKNLMNRLAGEQKVKNKLQKLNEKFFMTILGAFIGGLLGSAFFAPIGTLIGALIGASVLGSETIDIVSDGSGWEDVKTGSGWLAYLILIAMVTWIIVF